MPKMISDESLYAHMPQVEELLLRQIPSEDQLSYEFSHEFNERMKALLTGEQRTFTKRRMAHRLKIAVAIILVVVTLAFGVTMSVEAQRIWLFEFVTQTWKELTSVTVHSEGLAESDRMVLTSPSYIPEGYVILEERGSQYKHSIIYVDESGNEIYYMQKLLTQGEFIVDTEGVVPEEVRIGGVDGKMVVNKGVVQLYWYDSFHFYTLAGSLEAEELIKMAESLQK